MLVLEEKIYPNRTLYFNFYIVIRGTRHLIGSAVQTEEGYISNRWLKPRPTKEMAAKDMINWHIKRKERELNIYKSLLENL